MLSHARAHAHAHAYTHNQTHTHSRHCGTTFDCRRWCRNANTIIVTIFIIITIIIINNNYNYSATPMVTHLAAASRQLRRQEPAADYDGVAAVLTRSARWPSPSTLPAQPAHASTGRRPGRIGGSDGSGVRGPPPSFSCRPEGSTAGYLASPGAEPALARRRHHRPLFPRSCQFRRPRPPCIRVCAGGDARPPSHPCPRPLRRDTQLSAVGGGGVGGRSASQWPCYCRRTGSGLPAMAFAS